MTASGCWYRQHSISTLGYIYGLHKYRHSARESLHVMKFTSCWYVDKLHLLIPTAPGTGYAAYAYLEYLLLVYQYIVIYAAGVPGSAHGTCICGPVCRDYPSGCQMTDEAPRSPGCAFGFARERGREMFRRNGPWYPWRGVCSVVLASWRRCCRASERASEPRKLGLHVSPPVVVVGHRSE